MVVNWVESYPLKGQKIRKERQVKGQDCPSKPVLRRRVTGLWSGTESSCTPICFCESMKKIHEMDNSRHKLTSKWSKQTDFSLLCEMWWRLPVTMLPLTEDPMIFSQPAKQSRSLFAPNHDPILYISAPHRNKTALFLTWKESEVFLC